MPEWHQVRFPAWFFPSKGGQRITESFSCYIRSRGGKSTQEMALWSRDDILGIATTQSAQLATAWSPLKGFLAVTKQTLPLDRNSYSTVGRNAGTIYPYPGMVPSPSPSIQVDYIEVYTTSMTVIYPYQALVEQPILLRWIPSLKIERASKRIVPPRTSSSMCTSISRRSKYRVPSIVIHKIRFMGVSIALTYNALSDITITHSCRTCSNSSWKQ